MKRTKRFLAMLLMLILCVGEISSTGLKVSAAGDEELTEDENASDQEMNADGSEIFVKDQSNTMLGTSKMCDPSPYAGAWEGSYVYFGKYGDNFDKPLLYYVLDKSTTEYSKDKSKKTMFLDSSIIIRSSVFDHSSNVWADSYVRTALNDGFLSGSLTEREANAVVASYKETRSEKDGDGDSLFEFVPLTGEKIFLLDAVEATSTSYGYANNKNTQQPARMKKYGTKYYEWYLRSPHGTQYVGRVNNTGSIFYTIPDYGGGVSPAMNIDLSSVLFSSAVSQSLGKKCAEYKLTLLNDNMKVSYPSQSVNVTGNTVTVSYGISGSDAEKANQVTVLILDKEYKADNSDNAEILYYQYLDMPEGFSTSGKGTFSMPEGFDLSKWGTDYKVYILAEEVYGNKDTDYASIPVEIPKSAVIVEDVKQYDLWVGGIRVHEKNKGDILDDGTASYNPATNTLTFNNATVNTMHMAKNGKTMGIVASNMSLTIKGKVNINVPDADIAVHTYSLNGDVLTLDGNITINGSKTGILAEGMDIVFAGGQTDILDTTESAVKTTFDGKIRFGEGIDIILPLNAALITKENTTEIHESTNSGSPVVTTAVIGQTSGYNLWVNGIEVTASNKSSIACGSGTASYEPSTQTLTFNNATISDGYEYNTTSHYKAGIYSRNNALTVKGNVIIDNTELYTGIYSYDPGTSDRLLTLDGDIKIKVKQYGVNTTNKDVKITGSKLDIESGRSALNVNGDVSLGAGIKVLSPEGGVIKENDDYSRVYESESSTTVAKNAVIGIDTNIVTYTVTFDLNGKSGTAPVPQTVEKGKTAAKPSDPSAEGLKFVAWCTDKEGKNVYDFATPVTADITLYAKWVEASADTFTVTFDLNGKSGTAPAAQTVEKGKTVSKPADPKADGFVFKAWCTDKEGKKEYDFSTPVTANITLYAKWEKAEEPVPGPDPIDGGKSALDPVPELIPGVTKDLYLVKGQKFNIGQGWYVDKADKDSKKRVSISKKGAFKAKAEGEAVIKCGSGAEAWAVNLHISKPKMDKKSLKIQLETETEVKTEKIGLTYDKDNLDVLWYSANPDVVTVDDSGNVTTIGKGSSKVTAYINGSAYTCTVTVKEKVALLERTLHVAKGASKSISIKGLKKPKWDESVKDIVSVKKNKVTGLNAGTTVLSFTQDEKVYKVTVIVEDLTMSGTGLKAQGKPGSNKYIIDELKAKDETILSFAGVTQSVVFKSSKPDIAFIDEDLNVVIRNKGKAKFIAKINGKPVTISVNIK